MGPREQGTERQGPRGPGDRGTNQCASKKVGPDPKESIRARRKWGIGSRVSGIGFGVSGSGEEVEGCGAEVGDVGEDHGKAGGGDAEPLGEGGSVLRKRGGGDEGAAHVGVVFATEGERGEGSVELTALDAAAKDEVVVASGMIAAVGAAGGDW